MSAMTPKQRSRRRMGYVSGLDTDLADLLNELETLAVEWEQPVEGLRFKFIYGPDAVDRLRALASKYSEGAL